MVTLRITLILLGIMWFILYAFQPDKSLPDLHLDCLSINDGLTNNEVNFALEDQNGFMWFGTRDGLNRYDGYKFVTFRNDRANPHSLMDNRVEFLYEDRQGVLWVATGKGLDRLNPEIQGFSHYRPKIKQPASDTSLNISGIIEDMEGQFWVVLPARGLFRFNRKSGLFTPFHKEFNFESLKKYRLTGAIHETSPGILWLGTETGIICLDVKQGKIYQTNLNLRFKSGNQNFPVYAITESYNGSMWIGSGHQLIHLAADYVKRISENPILQNEDIRTFSIQTSLSKSEANKTVTISTIYEDDVRRVWIGSKGGGIYLFDPKKTQLTSFRPCNCLKNFGGLSSDWINAISRNRSGTYWICTSEGVGKFTFRSRLFKNYKIEEKIPGAVCTSEIRAINEDQDGNILIGSWGNGICTLDRNTGKFIRYPPLKRFKNNLENSNIGVILQDSQQNIWIGTDQLGGLNRYDPVIRKIINYPHKSNDPNSLSHNLVTSLLEDSKGRIWIGTGGGGLNIYSRNNDGFIHYRHSDSDVYSLSNDYIYCIMEDQNKNIWIGTANQLNRFDPVEKHFIRYQHQTVKESSFPADEIYSIHEDQNRMLWIGTNRGIAYITPETRYQKKFYNITEKQGLASHAIFGILTDVYNILWLLTNKGLSSYDPATSVVHNYSNEDGCATFSKVLSGAPNAYLRARNGDLFFGGINGLTQYQPRKANRTLIQPPPIVITDILLDGQPVNSDIPNLRNLNIPADYESFSFEFAILDFTISLDNEYVYKLEGFDHDWIYCGNQKYASYASVGPGSYIFQVKGAGHEGIWNDQGASINIKILPPLWTRGWIQLLAASILVTLIVLVSLSREFRLKRSRKSQEVFSKKLMESQEEERKRISSELHDSLGQDLLLISHEISRQKTDTFQKEEKQNQIASMVHDAIEEVREIAYNLHPHQLEKLGLKNALESTIKKANHASGIKFVAMIDQIDQLFSEQNQIHFFRIIQEGLTNICRHSMAKRAIIHIEHLKNEVKATIRDDGIGFQLRSADPSLPTGLGIMNMRERIKLLHGNLDIQSQPGKGTTLKVKIPLLSNGRVT